MILKGFLIDKYCLRPESANLKCPKITLNLCILYDGKHLVL